MSQLEQAGPPNLDPASVEHFGSEWKAFSQDRGWAPGRLRKDFEAYFAPIPPNTLTQSVVAADFGAGSGRWATFVAPLVDHLYVVEPSSVAMSVARMNLSAFTNITYVEEPIGGQTIGDGTLDFAYSIGVLHCVPDPERALKDLRQYLKPGARLLGYLYYALENRPRWYRAIWRCSDVLRRRVCRMPPARKRHFANVVAAVVYWPAARGAKILSRLSLPVSGIPLAFYSDKSFYAMRNDALDRFGTPLERRYTQKQISEMLARAGFDMSTLTFSDREPFWCFTVTTYALTEHPGPGNS